MKTFKGTKGVWKAYEGETNQITRSLFGKAGVSKEELHEVFLAYGRTPEKAEANARLIAASPELLETLIEVKNILESPKLIDAGVLRRLVNSAIKKALD